MKKIPMSAISDTIEALLRAKGIKATKYLAPNLIVRAVRPTYKFNNKRPDYSGKVELVLTIGRPNYIEREFVKVLKKAKEPFPVKKVILKLYTPKKKLSGRMAKK